MWELSIEDIVYVVEKCASNNVAMDRRTMRRIAMKVCALRTTLSITQLHAFIRAFVRWDFRDVRTFTPLALELVKRGDEASIPLVSESFEALCIEPPIPLRNNNTART